MIANPPYLKERDNAHFFKNVNQSSFGKKFHQGKMDFWYYFMHLAMNICNDEGVITFITSRYWINSQGARKLINRIHDELSFISVIDFGKLKVFDNVAGHHMVHLYSKKHKSSFIYKKVINDISVIDQISENENLTIKAFSRNEVFRNSEIIFSASDRSNSFEKLGDKYFLFQGVVEACDKISSKQFKKNTSKDINLGDGVFVLSEKEHENLNLNYYENLLIKNYLYPIEVEAYHINGENAKKIIYTDKQSKDLIKNDPNYSRLKKHLDKYQNFITSSNKPYGLHRPRVLEHFEKNKIIFKCMFVENSFAIDYDQHITGMSFVNIVSIDDEKQYSLEFLLGILNSKFAFNWFYNNGKKRGAGVDIGVEKLRSFPLPKILKPEQINNLKDLVNEMIDLRSQQKDSTEVKKEIDELILTIYDLTPDERKVILDNY